MSLSRTIPRICSKRPLHLSPSIRLLRTSQPLSPVEPQSAPRPSQSSPFSTSLTRQSGHGPEYDAPGGWLWGIKPGEKPEKEGWEGLWYWGFFGGLAAGVVAYIYKPDTSIQTWALEEARRRLEQEGYLPDASREG